MGKPRLNGYLIQSLPSTLSVLTALTLCFVAIAVTRGGFEVAFRAFLAMIWGAVGDWPRLWQTGDAGVILRPLGESGTKAALLLFTGLSVAVAFRVGLFNIGAQGQLMVGALASAVVGAQVQLPGPIHLFACLSAAALGGGLYALVPAWLKLHRGVHEVISTIMLNWVAVALIENWLVVGPLRAHASGDHSISGTAQIQPTAQLPRVFAELSRLNLGLGLALIAAFGTWLFFTRWRRGYEWRAVGLNREAARSAGIDTHRTVFEAMLLSGALAGLAGAVLVLGTEFKYPPTLAAPYGFDGISIALIGQSHPLGVMLSALFFGALRAGGTRLQLFGVHQSYPELIGGLALLLVAAQSFWQRLLTRNTKQSAR